MDEVQILCASHWSSLQTVARKMPSECALNLSPKFASNSRHKEEPNCGARHIRVELTVPADEAGTWSSWQNGTPVDENICKSDPAGRAPMRTRHRVARQRRHH